MKRFVAIILLSLPILIWAQDGFRYDDFYRPGGLIMMGNAHQEDGKARLVNAEHWQSGAIWYSDRKVSLANGFQTDFRFRISQPCECKGGADGVALVLHGNSSPAFLGEKGAGIGYAGISNSIALEFDAFDNREGSDHHVALHTQGSQPNKAEPGTARSTNHSLPAIKTGNVHHVRVIYQKGRMKVFMDDMSRTVLDVYITIDETIKLDGDKGWIGLTSSTGGGKANHDIISWSFEGKKKYKPTPVVQTKTKPAPKPRPNKTTVASNTPTLDDRTVTPQRVIVVRSPDISLDLWDHNRIDGDIVSIVLNGDWIINKVKLKKKKKNFQIHLDETDSELVLYAHNLGRFPPNTASMAINDGFRRQMVTLKSNLESSESVVIRYEPAP